MSDLSLYAHYTSLELRRHDHGVLEIVMNGAGANKSGLATADANMHRELADIWRDIDRDPDTRVALIRDGRLLCDEPAPPGLRARYRALVTGTADRLALQQVGDDREAG